MSPTELVLRWLAEAHRCDDLATYVRVLLDEPAAAPPANRLADEAIEGARARSRGRPGDEIETAVRTALRATIFRFELVIRINVRAAETLEHVALVHALLALRLALRSGP